MWPAQKLLLPYEIAEISQQNISLDRVVSSLFLIVIPAYVHVVGLPGDTKRILPLMIRMLRSKSYSE